jgi:hypothetical protein
MNLQHEHRPEAVFHSILFPPNVQYLQTDMIKKHRSDKLYCRMAAGPLFLKNKRGKKKAVPLHTMEAFEGGGGKAPTHS